MHTHWSANWCETTVWPEIFKGSQFSQFLRLTGDPRKLNPQNKSLNARSRDVGTRDNRGRGHHGACHCWIDLTAHTSSLLLSFFYINVSSLNHRQLSCHFSISAKYKYDRSIAYWFFTTFLAGSNEIWAAARVQKEAEPNRSCGWSNSWMSIREN